MDIKFILELLVILGALFMGARQGGVGLGLWGAVGLLVLVVGFGIAPAAIPGEVLIIVLTVIMAASAMEVAGGIDFLVRVAEKIIRKNPKQVTIVAPLVTYGFTFAAGTGHIVYPLLPVIYEVAHENGIRPERPMAVATIASQQAITASPVSAATAAMIGLMASHGVGLVQILLICVPSTLIAVLIAAFVQLRVGKELKDDPEYQRLLASGEIERPGKSSGGTQQPIKKGSQASAVIFLLGVAVVVLAGIFPTLRTTRTFSSDPLFRQLDTSADGRLSPSELTAGISRLPADSPATEFAQFDKDGDGQISRAELSAGTGGKAVMLTMPIAIAIVMLAVAALILTVTKAPVGEVPKCKTCQSGVTAIIGILGLAWLGDTFINANREFIIGGLSDMAKAAPWTFSIGLFVASMLLYSQAATTRALMPLGLSLGIPAPILVGMFPAVNGYFFIPNYGTLIAAMQFDRSRTTRIGKYLLNHSFMIPGLICTVGAVGIGLLIGSFFPK